MMFETKNPYFYVFGFCVIIVTSFLANKMKNHFGTEHDDEHEMIQKYLLNDSPLYGYNKPKLWVHTKHDLNARKWRDFMSRNTIDLNQPYIHMTVKSIIDHCGDDFNVCLVDDNTFAKLIPSWNTVIHTLNEPLKQRMRTLGMCQLVCHYGGMVVPNTLICLKSLKTIYDNSVSNEKPFVVENVNHSLNIARSDEKPLFIPDLLMFGSPKNNKMMKTIVEKQIALNDNPHVSGDIEFTGTLQHWLLDGVKSHDINLVDGVVIGVKTANNKPVLIDDLMGEQHLKLSPDLYGVYIPPDEILKRTKFQWFARMSSEQIMNTDIIIAKYIKNSMLESFERRNHSGVIPSAVSI